MSYNVILLNYDWNKDMNADDLTDTESARNQAINQLAEVCAAMGLSWSAGEKKFVIELPNVIVRRQASTVAVDLLPTRRKTFDISTWGDKGPVEGLPDDMQMPDYGEILDEGVPPQGDPSSEL